MSQDIRDLVDKIKTGELEELQQDVFGEEAEEEEAGQVDPDDEQISDDESPASVGEQDAEEESPEQELPPIDPPVSWSADAKEKFSALPRDVQEVIAQRESERERHFTQTQQKYAARDKALAKHKDFISRFYSSEDEAVERALEWYEHVHRNPVDAIRGIMQHGKISPELLTAAQGNVGPQDPYLRQALQELNTLKASIAEREAQEESARMSRLQAEVDSFINATGSDGKRLRPYADDLINDMAVFIPHLQQEMLGASTQEVLAEAYTRAMRANPKTYEAQMKQLEQQKARELSERAKKAKAAASSVSGSPNGSTSRVSTRNATPEDIVRMARAGQLS